MLLLRAYRPADRDTVRALFCSTLPGSFTEAEESELLRFLDGFAGPSFVLEQDGRTVAFGGLEARGERVDLCWGTVEEALHGQGLGLALTAFRLCVACEVPGAREVHLSARADTVGFYTRLGFLPEHATEDALRPQTDLIPLRMELTAASRRRVAEQMGAVVRARLRLHPALPPLKLLEPQRQRG